MSVILTPTADTNRSEQRRITAGQQDRLLVSERPPVQVSEFV